MANSFRESNTEFKVASSNISWFLYCNNLSFYLKVHYTEQMGLCGHNEIIVSSMGQSITII